MSRTFRIVHRDLGHVASVTLEPAKGAPGVASSPGFELRIEAAEPRWSRVLEQHLAALAQPTGAPSAARVVAALERIDETLPVLRCEGARDPRFLLTRELLLLACQEGATEAELSQPLIRRLIAGLAQSQDLADLRGAVRLWLVDLQDAEEQRRVGAAARPGVDWLERAARELMAQLATPTDVKLVSELAEGLLAAREEALA